MLPAALHRPLSSLGRPVVGLPQVSVGDQGLGQRECGGGSDTAVGPDRLDDRSPVVGLFELEEGVGDAARGSMLTSPPSSTARWKQSRARPGCPDCRHSSAASTRIAAREISPDTYASTSASSRRARSS